MKAGLIGGYGMGRWRPSQIAAGQGGKSGHGRQFRVSAGGTRKAYGQTDYRLGCFVVFNICGFTSAFKNK